jgi:hypothetical protein
MPTGNPAAARRIPAVLRITFRAFPVGTSRVDSAPKTGGRRKGRWTSF